MTATRSLSLGAVLCLGAFPVFAKATEGPIRIEDLMSRVVYLYQVQGSSMISGSGFLVADDNGRTFLVTASHVAVAMGPSSHFVLRSSGTFGKEFPLADAAANSKIPWVHNPIADVAALSLNDSLPGIEWAPHSIPLRYFKTDSEELHRTQKLVMMGFPLSLGAVGKFSPITKEVLPASDMITLPRFDTHQAEDFFLVDSPTIDGYSGAPVLAFPSDIPFGVGEIRLGDFQYCAGLVHGTIPDRTGGKLGAIVPAKYIVETIRMAAGKR